jgi:hypothetical protein
MTEELRFVNLGTMGLRRESLRVASNLLLARIGSLQFRDYFFDFTETFSLFLIRHLAEWIGSGFTFLQCKPRHCSPGITLVSIVLQGDKMKMYMTLIRVAPCIHSVIFKWGLSKDRAPVRDRGAEVGEIILCALNQASLVLPVLLL